MTWTFCDEVACFDVNRSESMLIVGFKNGSIEIMQIDREKIKSKHYQLEYIEK